MFTTLSHTCVKSGFLIGLEQVSLSSSSPAFCPNSPAFRRTHPRNCLRCNNNNKYGAETDFHIFVRGMDKYLGGGAGAAACFGRGVVATPGKAKEKV